MAGMEQIQIHSQSYLVRWVNAKPDHCISWTVQPNKKSINFGIFKHPGLGTSIPSAQSSAVALNSPIAQHEAAADGKEDAGSKEATNAVIEKLSNTGLKLVTWVGRFEADRPSQGRYDIPPGEAGNYALVFDNTFSKNTSKTATIFLLTYPSSYQDGIHFGAQVHHTSAMAGALALAPPKNKRSLSSPRLRAIRKVSADSLKVLSATQTHSSGDLREAETTTGSDHSNLIHTGVLQKLRRKKHQGYARRFFCLDFTSGTLSYYFNRNSSALRGSIPLSLAAVSANEKTRQISVDSGAEIWHLKANSATDFAEWKDALEKATRLVVEARTPGADLHVQTSYNATNGTRKDTTDDQEWARLEILLSKISGTRDAVRRLCLQTLSQPLPAPSPRLPRSGESTPTESAGEDYFKIEQPTKSFWKRKPSSNLTQNNSMFKRSVSAQTAMAMPITEPSIRNPDVPRLQARSDDDRIHDNCRALLQDLDSVVSEFSYVVARSKQRRPPPPSSAMSRLSIMSVESMEYFDAEDKVDSGLLDIQDDDSSTSDYKTDSEGVVVEEDSATSSDVEDESFDLKSNLQSGNQSSTFPTRPKTFSPLPLDRVRRRQTVKAPTIMPPSLIGFLRKNVGKDLSTISMPVSANEPTSLLQRAAEQLEYSELLDHAAKATTSSERLMYVTAFAISSFSNVRVKERSIRKPFNPMLGETYELVREVKGFRFISEKVSHHPVQLAFQADSPEWSFSQSPKPTQKFWGKSSEIITEGKARLVLHTAQALPHVTAASSSSTSTPNSECYTWNPATSFLRNILAGEKYVEPVGSMTVSNETTGAKAVITFKSKGMFGGRSEEVEVTLFDEHNTPIDLGLHGTWTSSLQLTEHGVPTKATVWEAGELVPQAAKHYGMTKFAAELNEVTSIEQGKVPSTDSRLRPDQRALEEGQNDEAEHLKVKLEEAQRARRKDMEGRGEMWAPRWFVKVENGNEVVWKLKSGKEGYWEERQRGEWKDVVRVLEV